MPLKKLVIFPFNGNGIEALDCIDTEQYELISFIDDDPQKRSDEYPVNSRTFLKNIRSCLFWLYQAAIHLSEKGKK